MRILLVHNQYQLPGGEDQVFRTEGALLAQHGHEVVRLEVHNNEIQSMNAVQLAGRTLWNGGVNAALQAVIGDRPIDVAHVHNTFPLISPSVYQCLEARDIPVVQTLHNYRLICPSATLFRQGQPCEDCIGKALAWPAGLHACYRGSTSASLTTAAMLTLHRGLGTWNKVHTYIALSRFSKRKFVEGGLPESRIVVKFNSLGRDPGALFQPGRYLLFVGRVASEKGLDLLLRAYRTANLTMPLLIAGDGPLREPLQNQYPSGQGIEWLGFQDSDSVRELMRGALALVIPSVWYEGARPLTLIEAYALGVPVIASDHGCLSESVEHQVTGWKFEAGNVDQLRESLVWFQDHQEEAFAMRRNARDEFLRNYTPLQNYESLMSIYEAALGTGVRANEPVYEAVQG